MASSRGEKPADRPVPRGHPPRGAKSAPWDRQVSPPEACPTPPVKLSTDPLITTSLERRAALIDSLEQRVLVLDGAMGTMIHQAPLSIETDYLGRENCPEILNVTRPDVILDIHRQYLEIGRAWGRDTGY